MTRRQQITTLSDAQLVQEYRNGNSPALDVLVNRYQSELFKYTAKIAGHHLAADALQDTWVVVITGILDGSYKEGQHFERWIKRIAHGKAVDAWRVQHRFDKEHEPADSPDETLNAEENMAAEESQSAFYRLYHRHIRKLTPDEAELIKLRFEKNLDNSMISAIRHITVKSVKEMVSHALAKLRILMNGGRGAL